MILVIIGLVLLYAVSAILMLIGYAIKILLPVCIIFTIISFLIIFFIKNDDEEINEEINDEKLRQQEEKKLEALRIEEAKQRRQEEEQRIYELTKHDSYIAYQNALKGTDKIDAANKGRVYYSLVQFGIDALTTDYTTQITRKYTEQLKFDISLMNVN